MHDGLSPPTRRSASAVASAGHCADDGRETRQDRPPHTTRASHCTCMPLDRRFANRCSAGCDGLDVHAHVSMPVDGVAAHLAGAQQPAGRLQVVQRNAHRRHLQCRHQHTLRQSRPLMTHSAPLSSPPRPLACSAGPVGPASSGPLKPRGARKARAGAAGTYGPPPAQRVLPTMSVEHVLAT